MFSEMIVYNDTILNSLTEDLESPNKQCPLKQSDQGLNILKRLEQRVSTCENRIYQQSYQTTNALKDILRRMTQQSVKINGTVEEFKRGLKRQVSCWPSSQR
eukprot:TRINITY_DN422_c0_g1_i1.p1 TRINITY_DN422_c0_g1~~TRINITY_DN422_c0_g1_i1.p1  ORF type:complete len:102 (-),score=7.62 TRINITY_DN422_c0_g1_i1:234-539(-)